MLKKKYFFIVFLIFILILTINVVSFANEKNDFKNEKIPKNRNPFWFKLISISPKYSNAMGNFGTGFNFYVEMKREFYAKIKNKNREYHMYKDDLFKESEQVFGQKGYSVDINLARQENETFKKWTFNFSNYDIPNQNQNVVIKVPYEIENYYGWEKGIIDSYNIEKVLRKIFENIFNDKYDEADKKLKEVDSVIETKDPRILYLKGLLAFKRSKVINNGYNHWKNSIKLFETYGKAQDIITEDYILNYYFLKTGKKILKLTIGEETSNIGLFITNENKNFHFRDLKLKKDELILDYNGDLVNVEKAYKNRLTIGATEHFKNNIAKFIRYLFSVHPKVKKVRVNVFVPAYKDKFGNLEDKNVGYVEMDKQTAEKINWENIRNEMIADLFKEEWYWEVKN